MLRAAPAPPRRRAIALLGCNIRRDDVSSRDTHDYVNDGDMIAAMLRLGLLDTLGELHS